MKNIRFLCLPLAIALAFPPVAKGDPVHLDLSSSDANLSAQNLIPSGQSGVNITQDGKTVTIAPGDMITPAQMVAVGQALAGGQTLNLNASGVAIGGSFALTGGLSQNLAGLNVPSGVTAIQDFASSGLNLAGNFSNSGIFYAVSSSTNVATAVIQATNIFNQPGALLTSVLPTGGLPGYSNLISNLNLSLIASNNIVNYGTITSSAGLTATAGGSISNLASVGNMPIMQALNDIVMQATTISNAGSILSQNGAVNIATANLNNQSLIQSVMQGINIETRPGDQVLNVLNNSGVISSLKELAFVSNGDLSIEGGTLNGETIKLAAPTGLVSVNMSDLVAPVYLCAKDAHIIASGSLNLHSDVSGDPVYMAAAGDFIGSISPSNESVAIAAKGDIVITGGIDLTGGSGTLYMLAGVRVTNQGATVLVEDVVGNSGKISVSSSILGKNDVVLAAFNGPINIGDVSTDGKITLLTDGQILTGNLTSNGSNIFIKTLNPILTGPGKSVTFDNQPVTGGTLLPAFGVVIAGSASPTGSSITTSNLLASGNVSVLTNGSVTTSMINASNVDVQVGTAMALSTGSINAPSGIVTISSPNILQIDNPINVSATQLKLFSGILAGDTLNVNSTITCSGSSSDIFIRTAHLAFGAGGAITTPTGAIDVDTPGLGLVLSLNTSSATLNAQSIRIGPTTSNNIVINTSAAGNTLFLNGNLTGARLETSSGDITINSGANIKSTAPAPLSVTANGAAAHLNIGGKIDSFGALTLDSAVISFTNGAEAKGSTVALRSTGRPLQVKVAGGGVATLLANSGAVTISGDLGVQFSKFNPGIATLNVQGLLSNSVQAPSGNVTIDSSVVLSLNTMSNIDAPNGSVVVSGEIDANFGFLTTNSKSLDLGAGSMIKASSFNANGTGTPYTINLQNGSTANISASFINFDGKASSLTVQLGGGSTPATLNLNGSTMSKFMADTVTVANNVLVSSSNSLDFNGKTINISGDVNAGDITLASNTIGGIINTSGTLTAANNLSVNNMMGGDITIGGTVSAGKTVSIMGSTSGLITTTANITAGNDFNVNAFGSIFNHNGGKIDASTGNVNINAGTITIAAPVTAVVGDIKLSTALGLGLGTITTSGNMTAGKDLSINSMMGNITTGGIITVGNDLTVGTSSGAYTNGGGGITATGTINVNAGGAIVINGGITGQSTVFISGGSISHNGGTLKAGSSSLMQLFAMGNITQATTSRVTAGSIKLNALAIGTSMNYFKTDTVDLEVFSNDAFVDNVGNVSLRHMGIMGPGLNLVNSGNVVITMAQGPISVLANGNISTTNPILLSAAGSISLVSTATNGGITIGDGAGDNLSAFFGSVTLTATGTGAITTINGITILADTLNLNSGTGSVTDLVVDVSNIHAVSGSSIKINNTKNMPPIFIDGTFGNLNYSNTGFGTPDLTVGKLTSGNVTLNVSGNVTITDAFSGSTVTFNSSPTATISNSGSTNNLLATSLVVNAGFVINLSKVSTPDIKLNSSGAVTIIEDGPSVTQVQGQTGTLSLDSKGPVTIPATGLMANGSVSIISMGDLTVLGALQATGASSLITLDAAGKLDVNAPITAQSVSLSTQPNFDITINNSINGSLFIGVFAKGSGNIIQGATGGLFGDAVMLSSDSRDIGNLSFPVRTTANSIQVLSGRDVFIQETDVVQLISSVATSSFNLTAGGDITTKSITGQPIVSAPNVNINTPGKLSLSGDFVGSSKMTITADQIQNNVLPLPTLVSQDLVLNANKIGTGVSDRIQTKAGNLTLSKNGADVFIGNMVTSNLNLKPSTGKTIDIVSKGDITIFNGNSNATSLLSLNSQGGKIINPSGLFTLNVPSGTIVLDAQLDIGAAAAPIRTEAATLYATSRGGNVYIVEQDGLLVEKSSAVGTFDLSAGGDLHLGGVVNPTIIAGDLKLSTTNSGSIYVDHDLAATNSLILQSALHMFDPIGGGLLTAQQVELRSTSPIGLIGQVAGPIRTSASSLLADTSGGKVFIQNSKAVTLQTSRGGTYFNLMNSNGDLTISGGVQALITFIQTNIGNIIVDTSAPLSNGGAVTLAALSTGSISANTAMGFVPVLTLIAPSGNIGGPVVPMDVSTPVLSATAGGDVFIRDNQVITSLGTSAAGSKFHLIAPAGVTSSGPVTAFSVVIDTASLTNNGNISATNSITLNTPTLTNNSAITADSITLNTSTLTNNSTISGKNGITISDIGSTNITGSGKLLSDSPITLSSAKGSVIASQQAFETLTGLPGTVTGNALGVFNLTAGNGFKAATVSAGTGITMTASTGDLTATDVNAGLGTLSLTSTTGKVAASTLVADSSITVTAGVDISATMLTSNNGAVTLTAPGNVNAVDITTTNGGITASTTTGALTATNLNTTNGFITLSTTVGGLNAQNLTTTSGAITLSSTVGNMDAKSLKSDSGAITLSTTTGTLVAGGPNGITTDSGIVTITSAGGDLIVDNVDTTSSPVTITNTSGKLTASDIDAGGAATLSTMSGDLFASIVLSGGPVTMTTATGNLSASDLDAVGNVTLSTTGTTSGDMIVSNVNTTGLGNLSLTTAKGNIDVTGDLYLLNGTISISSGDKLTVNTPAAISGGNFTLNAVNDVFVGGSLQAGTINGPFIATSTNMADYDYSAITTPGAVAIRSSNGLINSASGTRITSIGASISFASPGNISIGAGSDLFAQAGNITVNSWNGDVSIGDTSVFQAVARSIVPSAPLTIDGQQINMFVGGDIGIDVDINVATTYGSYDNFLRSSFDLNRVVNGNMPGGTFNYVGTIINMPTPTLANGAMVDLTSSKISKIDFGSNVMINADGGVVQIDPPTSNVIIGNNVAFNALGPNLLGGGNFIVPPPPPNNNPAPPPIVNPAPPLIVVLPPLVGAGGGGGGGAPAGPGAGGPVTPVDVVNPVAQVPIVAPVPPPAIQTDVIVLAANEEKQEKKDTNFAVKNKDFEFFVPITYVGTAPCQQFLLAGKGRGDLQCVTVVASRGTVLGTVKPPEKKDSFASRLLSLKEGKIVVVSGQKSGMKLDVADATVNLPVGSVAVVHRKASGGMRVSMVSGGTVSVSIKGAAGDQLMTAAPGEEIAIGGTEEELIAADGIERQLISAKMVMTVDEGGSDDMLKGGVSTTAIGTTTASNLKPGKRSLRVEKRSFDREKMSEGENLLACLDCAKIGCSSSMCRLQRSHFTQPKTKTKKLTASSKKELDETRDAHVFSPVAYKISLQPPTAAPTLSTLQLGTAMVKHAGGANITSTERNVITASQGEVLVCSSKPTVVKAGGALVECSPDSLLLINTTGKSVSVSSLWQEGSVTVHAGSRNYKMRPGEECIIAGSNQTQKALQANAAARRNVRNFSVGGTQSMSVSEISLASVFLTSPVLQQLRHSQESVDKNLANRIAKMYAVLNIVTGRRGPYSYSSQ